MDRKIFAGDTQNHIENLERVHLRRLAKLEKEPFSREACEFMSKEGDAIWELKSGDPARIVAGYEIIVEIYGPYMADEDVRSVLIAMIKAQNKDLN